jgi:predicted AAA+ superfamily ATPase
MDTTANLEQTLRYSILDNQQNMTEGTYVSRFLAIERKSIIITGMRRVGKSVYQRLYMQTLLKAGVPKENFCILDFSDDRLFQLRNEQPSIVADAYYTLYPQKTKEKVYFFFDEIQYLYHWELFVNHPVVRSKHHRILSEAPG